MAGGALLRDQPTSRTFRKNESDCPVPRNSTAIVTALMMNKSAIEKLPQSFPNLALGLGYRWQI